MSKTDLYNQQLRTAISRWVDLTDAQWQRFNAIFHLRTVAAGEHVLLPGDSVYELYFVCSGLLRVYYLSEEGTESNKAFIAENAFSAPLAAAALNLPVSYGAQALEPTTLQVARYADFVALFDADPIFDRLGRKLAEALLVHKELRARNLLQYDAKERYQAFKRQFPHLMDRIPQYHIASYLGVTEVSLSRIKRTMRQKMEERTPTLVANGVGPCKN